MSYLASAELWTVPEFPAANQGAEIVAVEHSIAADAPMTAAALSALGVRVQLVANDFGDDIPGHQVLEWLLRYGVNTTSAVRPGFRTPRIVVVADNSPSRTWFAHLPGVVDSLARMVLPSLDTAPFVYLDAYQLIETAARAVAVAASVAGVPLLLNLGGSIPSAALVSAVRDSPGLIVQTNVDDGLYATAPSVGAVLRAQLGAEWAVVTAGVFGAVAVGAAHVVTAPAFRVAVRHTHCAGAAFSAGLLFGLCSGLSMGEAMMLGSASGALRCKLPQCAPMPTPTDLHAVIASGERIGGFPL